MKIQKQIDVRLVRKGPVSSLRVVQYDTGVQLVFNLLDFDLPSGTTATLYVRKKSGKFVYQEKGITVSGNTVTVDLENQALTEHGEAFYQLRFLNGSDVISTFSSSMYVERSLADADAEESTTVIAAFEAKTAEQIAQIEAAAQEQIEQIQNMFNTYATKNEAAYAIKGNLSGAVVSACDVATMEHNPVVWVHGKNLLNVEDCEISNFTGYHSPIALNYEVEAGKTYTLSFDVQSSVEPFITSIGFGSKTAYYVDAVYSANQNSGRVVLTFTPSEKVLTNGKYIHIRAPRYSEPKTYTATISNIQLEEGSIATAFEPYLDPSTVTVTRCGKNLIPFPYVDGDVGDKHTNAGITYTVNADKSITANGTATTNSYFRLCNASFGESYIYENNTNGEFSCLDCQYDDGNQFAFIMILKGTTVTNRVYHPQIEHGAKNTAWESPKGRVDYTTTADGTVPGLTSLSPNMTILTDNAGAIVVCEYNVDTKTYIKNMLSGASTTRITDVELLASAWEDTELPYLYAQVINIPGTTEFSQVNLNPSVEQMSIFYEKNLSFITENEDGVVTVYAIGQKPMNDYVIQTAIREVSA